MKTLIGFVFALLVTVLSTYSDAQAQAYVVCNNSNVPVNVCIRVSCGGVGAILAPCPAMIPPGACFTWNVPAGCIVAAVRVNGVGYPVPGMFPFCYPVAAPPPNAVCFTGGIPQVIIQ